MKLAGCVLGHELKKVFGDKKMLFSMFILPIILVLVTSILTVPSDDTSSAVSKVFVLNNAKEIQGENVVRVEEKTLGELRAHYTLFSEDVVVESDGARTILYYNGANEISRNEVRACREQLIQENMLRSINETGANDMSEQITIVDVNENISQGMKLTSLLLPYVLVLSLFQDTSSFSIDVIAGEKERGVFDTVMLTPVSSIVYLMGKVASTTICGLLSSGAYMLVVTVFSFVPGLDVFGLQNTQITLSMFGMICVCAILLSILFSGISILLSLTGKTVAEAKSKRLPIYGITILLALASMMRMGSVTRIHYMIPIYNICIMMQDLLNSTVKMGDFLCVIGSLMGCCLLLLTIMVLVVKKRVYDSWS